MKKYTALLLALLLALSLTACGQTEDTGGTEWEYPAAFAGLETLVEQAQAEGGLTVYGSCPAAYLTAACETFETLFNVRVSYQQVSDQAVLDKLSKPGRPGADVWFGADSGALEQATSMGGLTAYVPAAAAGLSDSDFAGADGQWYGIAVDPLGLMVNTASLKAMEIGAPEDWADLTELEYWELVWLPGYDTTEGRLLAQAAWDAFGDKAEKYLLELDENVAQYTEDGDPAAKYVGTGECVVAVGLLSSGAAQRLENSYDDIRLVTPRSGTPYVLNGSAILRGTAHSAAAQLWMEFVLSPTCQALAAMNGWCVWPTVENVSLPEDLAQLNVDLDGLTCRLPMGEDAEALDSLIGAVQTVLNPPAEN